MPPVPLTEAERMFLREVHAAALELTGGDNRLSIYTAALALHDVDWAIRQACLDAPSSAPADALDDDKLGEIILDVWLPKLIAQARTMTSPVQHLLARYPTAPPAGGWPALPNPPRIVVPKVGAPHPAWNPETKSWTPSRRR